MFDFTLGLDLIYLVGAAACLWLGRLIADSKVTSVDKSLQRSEGFLFSLIYVMIPASGAYVLLASDLLWFDLHYGISLIGLFLILSVYRLNFLVNKDHKYDLSSTQRFSDKIDERMEEIPLSEDLADKGREFLGMDYEDFFREVLFPGIKSVTENKKVLMVLSGLTTFFFLSALGSNLFIMLLSGSMAVLSYSAAAIAYGYSRTNYSDYLIELKDGREISGRLIKKNDKEITLLDGEERISVSIDEVKSRRKSIWKDEKPYSEGNILENAYGSHSAFNYFIRSREDFENIEGFRSSFGNWLQNENFDEFVNKEIDVAIVYEYTDEGRAIDIDNLVKPVVSALEKDDRAVEGQWLVEDDRQIRQVLAKSIEREDIGQEDVPVEKNEDGGWRETHGRVTVSFREHSEKPMKLVHKRVM